MIDFITAHQADLVTIGTALVTIFSVLANIVPKDSVVGKICNFIALNFKR